LGGGGGGGGGGAVIAAFWAFDMHIYQLRPVGAPSCGGMG